MTPLQKAQERAAQSGGRAAGYCWLEHPDGGAHCTRTPHTDPNHVDYYTGRPSITATHGYEWTNTAYQ